LFKFLNWKIERVNVIDRKIFRGGLFENLDSARIYLQEHLNMRYEYEADWRRKNIVEKMTGQGSFCLGCERTRGKVAIECMKS